MAQDHGKMNEVEELARAPFAEEPNPSRLLSQKEKRRRKRRKLDASTPESSTPEPTAVPTAKTPRSSLDVGSDSLPTPEPTPMQAARQLPLLICSIGNPGSTYANTLHSAGHAVVQRLAASLGSPAFQKSRELGNGLVSKTTSPDGGDWTLWQSNAYMNESGKGVKSAYESWSRHMPDGGGKLVIVHDELEKPIGAVTLKVTQGASAKGHNGLKSILSVIGKNPFVRIGIGIGRPASRDSNDVASYVLRKMTPKEKQSIEDAVEDVIMNLKQIGEG